MKLLVTTGGIMTPSIHDALIDLVGKPIAECGALVTATTGWDHGEVGVSG